MTEAEKFLVMLEGKMECCERLMQKYEPKRYRRIAIAKQYPHTLKCGALPFLGCDMSENLAFQTVRYGKWKLKEESMICEVCGSEMYEAICAGQPWWVCNCCGNWEETR